MKENNFLMPDYYKNFSCKMGKCRTACCEGWPITFSVEDYYKLMGMECSENLRNKLDRGIKVSLSPTPDMYATILPRYDGSCPMREPDGRCSIHAELGENALSDVCRLYPRGLRVEPSEECSCSNSCEGVLEILFYKKEPITFIKDKCIQKLPPVGKRAVTYQTMGKEQEIRLHLISLIQNRTTDISSRISTLGYSMYRLEQIIQAKDKEALFLWLETEKFSLEQIEAGFEHIKLGIEMVEEILKIICKKSDGITPYVEEAISNFEGCEDVLTTYNNLKNRFETLFPEWEIFFEHMLVNHMFFEQFPFQDRPVSLWNEFVSFSVTYSMMKFLAVGCFSKERDEEKLIDMFSSIFRLVDHTDFESYISRTLNQMNASTPQKLFDIISI